MRAFIRTDGTAGSIADDAIDRAAIVTRPRETPLNLDDDQAIRCGRLIKHFTRPRVIAVSVGIVPLVRIAISKRVTEAHVRKDTRMKQMMAVISPVVISPANGAGPHR